MRRRGPRVISAHFPGSRRRTHGIQAHRAADRPSNTGDPWARRHHRHRVRGPGRRRDTHARTDDGSDGRTLNRAGRLRRAHGERFAGRHCARLRHRPGHAERLPRDDLRAGAPALRGVHQAVSERDLGHQVDTFANGTANLPRLLASDNPPDIARAAHAHRSRQGRPAQGHDALREGVRLGRVAAGPVRAGPHQR